jgi:hypothetical protein
MQPRTESLIASLFSDAQNENFRIKPGKISVWRHKKGEEGVLRQSPMEKSWSTTTRAKDSEEILQMHKVLLIEFA